MCSNLHALLLCKKIHSNILALIICKCIYIQVLISSFFLKAAVKALPICHLSPIHLQSTIPARCLTLRAAPRLVFVRLPPPRRVVDDRSFGDRTTCSTRRKGDRGSLWRALRLAKTCKGLTGYFSARTVLGANAPELEKKELLQAGTSLGSDHSVQILPFRQPPAAVQPPASSLGGTKVKPNARPSLMPCTIRKEYVNVE